MAAKQVKLTRAEYSRRLAKIVRIRKSDVRYTRLGELNRLWNLRQGGAR